MKIVINGQSHELADSITLAQGLDEFGAVPPYAVAVNGQFVPRSRCSDVTLEEGDSIELLSPIQGG
ncbi:sulfur carrier protein ThiS [Pseudoalteromonas mariniglutinosa]|uniref:sulfur carrier protein ThiS n=1 Tax=Pseudoalteromonas mariniglutinosa TaxID=206042 RepID=UPI00384FFF7A